MRILFANIFFSCQG